MLGISLRKGLIIFKNTSDELMLNRLCDIYGSDKGSEIGESHVYGRPSHNYTKVYSALFSQIKLETLCVFECGLGTNNENYSASMGPNGKPGASLRVWRDYFPNAKIYGADIDKDVLFNEDRIFTGYMDQTSPISIARFWKNHNIRPNIIIDDGLHEYTAGICLYENSFERLEPGGIYIIEDIREEDVPKYKTYFDQKPLDAVFVSLNRTKKTWDDNTMLILFK